MPRSLRRFPKRVRPFWSAALLLAGLSPAWGFDYLNVRVQPEAAVPSACLTFSTALAKTDQTTLGAFVAVTPPVDHSLEIRGRDLCVRGLQHGATYAIHVKAGLLAKDGSTGADVNVQAKIPDREPQVSFHQGKTILPLAKGVGLPLDSVNVLKAHVALYRFNDRSTVDHLADDWFGQDLGYEGLATIADRATKLFEGTLDIAAVRNRQVSTTIPIEALIKTLQPGVYVAVANDASKDKGEGSEKAAQWFSVSDIGLATIKADGAMLLVARSLRTAAPVQVTVRLMSRANEVLGSYRTDANGQATIPAGLLRGEHGNAPQVLLATDAAGSFTWLRLDDASLDLSDLDMRGREPPATTDAFLWTDRGIYRPGETVHAGLLVRDRDAQPVAGASATVHVVRPDGVEVQTRSVATPMAGGGTFDVAMPDNAFSGTWTFWVDAGDKRQIGSTQVLVQDFVPPRLEAKVATTPGAANGATAVDVRADYFYGSPGAALSGVVEGTLQDATEPFPALAGFRFGLVQDAFLAQALKAEDFVTDAEGAAHVAMQPEAAVDTSHPLQLAVRATVNDVDGRPAVATATTPVRTGDRFIGLKPIFDTLSEGATASFAVALVDAEGHPVGNAGLKWDLVKEEYDFEYFFSGGRWQFRESIIDSRTNGGEIVLDGAGRGTVAAKVHAGRWRIEAYDPSTNAATSVRFNAGWWAVSETENRKPAVMAITVDRAAPAGKVRAMLEPAFNGKVVVALDGNGLHGVQEIDARKGGTPVEFDAANVPPAGATIVAVAVSPAGAVVPRLPVRAVGLAFVPGAAAAHALDVALDAPATIRPETDLAVDVAVRGATAGEDAYVTLAAVDEAVERMTSFATPAPGEHFLGRRRPDIEIRDVYNQLIDPAGTPGALKEGGDGSNANLNMGGLDVKTFKTVALFKGPVKVDATGHARVRLAVPDFSGRLRLMAVAWTADKFGATARPVTVRPPLLAELTLPRFLAPGDTIRARVMLTDLEAPEQDYAVTLSSTGPLTFDHRDAPFASLKRNARRTVDRTLTAGSSPGVGRIHLSARGTDGTSAERDFEITVRTPNAFVTERQVVAIPPGGKLTVDDALDAGFAPGTGKLAVTASASPAFDVPGLLASLRRYPYGCAEQTVSRAFPELFARRLGGDLPAPTPEATTGQGALERLVSLQSPDGSFGYWTAFDAGNIWLTAYALDFMQQAKRAGLSVPTTMQARATAWLAGQFASAGSSPLDVAGASYAAIVLSRADSLDLSQLRYVASRVRGGLPTEAARVELAAALSRVGERDTAAGLLGGPRIVRPPAIWLNDYGSALRDQAMALALMAEEKLLPRKALFEKALDLSRAVTAQRYLSTQDEAWILRVAADLKADAPLKVDIDGVPNAPGSVDAHATLPLGTGKTKAIANRGSEQVYVAVASTGIPTGPQPAEANGFTVSRDYRHLDGTPVDLADVHQNDEIVVVLAGAETDTARRKTLVVDMFPAGLEPEPIGLATDRDDGAFKWLTGLTEPTFFALRDDRYMAGIDAVGGPFKFAYVVRAVTPGTFALPGPQVEDMYAPAYHAHGAAGTIEVKAARVPAAPTGDGAR